MSDTITLDKLRAALDGPEPRPVLVEALPTPYYRHTHLPGALNLPPDRTAELAPALLPDRHAPIVVYCANPACPHAAATARALTDLGYTNVRDFAGGKEEWQAAGLPVEGMARRHRNSTV
jgi:rhodanese-related sulfurtransferase